MKKFFVKLVIYFISFMFTDRLINIEGNLIISIITAFVLWNAVRFLIDGVWRNE